MLIDKKRIAAVKFLEERGFTFSLEHGWQGPQLGTAAPNGATDAMHILLIRRADALAGCAEGSDEEAELAEIATALEMYELQRWPEGKIPGGKG